MTSQILNVIQKEFKDTIRDRRTLMAAFTFAIFGPGLLYILLNTIAQSTEDDTSISAAIVGEAYAPNLVAWLEERNISFTNFETEQEAIEATNKDLLTAMVISSDYTDDYLANRPAEIRIYGDFKRRSANTEARRLERFINAYGGFVSRSRMAINGVPISQTEAIAVETYDLSRAGGNTTSFSGMLTYMFLMAGFISGAFIAADSIAGERERHSLQPLLSQPVTPLSLVAGKWIVAAIVSLLVSTVTICLGGFLLSIAPLGALGLRFFTDPQTVILAALAAIPLAAAAPALQIFIAAQTKTYREASTYAQYTMFLPIIVVGATQFANVEYPEFANFLPITGQDYAIRELFLEGAVPVLPILLSSLTTFGVAGIFVVLTTIALGSEKSLG